MAASAYQDIQKSLCQLYLEDIRLAITQANGVEHEQVVHFTADEKRYLRQLQVQFEATGSMAEAA